MVALDCRITVDDAAVFRHAELGIEVARELGHPPTPLERIAWDVEKDDYRGTFYFLQMREGFSRGRTGRGVPRRRRRRLDDGDGRAGQRTASSVANFCDTSGNPPASKVYRAARILLSQPGVDGYFGTGSGVASQEQFHSARGLVKAFLEEPLAVPAVVRLGGNGEEKAIEILTTFTTGLGVPVECYGKDTPVDACAARLVGADRGVRAAAGPSRRAANRPPRRSPTPSPRRPARSPTTTPCAPRCASQGVRVRVRAADPRSCPRTVCPCSTSPLEEAQRGRCTECLACEVDCRALGARRRPRPACRCAGLDEYRRTRGLE